MSIITVDQVKQFTTLTDANNAAITAAIPFIDSAVKAITGRNWNYQIIGKVTHGVQFVEAHSIYDSYGRDILGINNRHWRDNIGDYLRTGAQLSGEGIPNGAYIAELYVNGPSVEFDGTIYSTPVIMLSAAANASADSAQIFLGMPIAYTPIIAKGVQWLIAQSASASDPGFGLVSRTMGPMSWNFGGANSEIDGRYGMPAWFVKALPKFQTGF